MAYFSSAGFSRPVSYDPDLANRSQQHGSSRMELVGLAEEIADKQRRSLRRELGISDSEEEEDCKNGEEPLAEETRVEGNVVPRDDYEELQQRYLATVKSVREMGERERKAVEQASRIKQMSISQMSIVRSSYKSKFDKHASALETMLSSLEESKAGQGIGQQVRGALEEHRSWFAISNEDTIQKNPYADKNTEDASQLRRQLESALQENDILRKSVDDLSVASSLLASLPETNNEGTEESKDGSSRAGTDKVNSKLNEMSSETLKSKLVKALKVAKHTQAKLTSAEREREELIGLLREAQMQLEQSKTSASSFKGAAAALTVAPSVEPTGEDSSEKASKVREKFDRLKQRCVDSERERDEARAALEELRASISRNASSSAANNEKLTAALKAERGERQRLAKGLASLGSSMRKERQGLSTLRKELLAQTSSVQEECTKGIQRMQRIVAQRQAALSGMVEKYDKECRERRRLFNLVQELRGNIRVLCRVRPVLPMEQGTELAVRFPNDGEVEVKNTKGRDQRWEFDHVFPLQSNNELVFEQVRDLCTSVLDGFNCCIFAYGQTGSGKTHTMEGNEADRGVNFRALDLLFANMATRRQGSEWSFQIQVSLLEIYNEQIRDLLDPEQSKTSQNQKKLEVKAGKHGMHVPGLTMVPVENQSQIMQLMQLGKRNRTTACTQMNSDSSRSHSMLSVYVTGANLLTREELRGKLHLIDLAGSERVSKSGVKGAQLTEATNINKSLSALGDVIQARANKQQHVPYRNSTLTYLLQDSLSHDSKTLMIVQCSPVASNAGETVCSLNFAARARQVELGKATRHAKSTDPDESD